MNIQASFSSFHLTPQIWPKYPKNFVLSKKNILTKHYYKLITGIKL